MEMEGESPEEFITLKHVFHFGGLLKTVKETMQCYFVSKIIHVFCVS